MICNRSKWEIKYEIRAIKSLDALLKFTIQPFQLRDRENVLGRIESRLNQNDAMR